MCLQELYLGNGPNSLVQCEGRPRQCKEAISHALTFIKGDGSQKGSGDDWPDLENKALG
jgi:hypothetical protein